MGETQETRAARQVKISRKAIPGLELVADSLVTLYEEIYSARIPYKADDGADVMVLSFVTKQREHLRSVRALIAADLHRDALLISRTMLEGLARLLWASSKRPERTELWLWFGAILDWRRTLLNEAAGMQVDPQDKIELKALVDTHGPNYYRGSVQKALTQAKDSGTQYQLPADPWTYDWTQISLHDMFQGIQSAGHYEAYRRTSEWAHWGPRAILWAMDSTEWGTAGFTQHDWRSAAEAIQTADQSLLQSLQVLNTHFSLGLDDRLSTINTEMKRVMNEALNA